MELYDTPPELVAVKMPVETYLCKRRALFRTVIIQEYKDMAFHLELTFFNRFPKNTVNRFHNSTFNRLPLFNNQVVLLYESNCLLLRFEPFGLTIVILPGYRVYYVYLESYRAEDGYFNNMR